jgi:hypothetical protein
MLAVEQEGFAELAQLLGLVVTLGSVQGSSK